MVTIDIPVSEKLQTALEPLSCKVIALPKAKPLEVHLPTGGSLKAFTDASKAIPTDCALNANLLLQLAPLLAALDCPMKILKTIQGLMEVLTSLPNVTKIPAFVAQVAEDLGPCFLAITPAGMLPFVIDLLRLIRSVLNCLLGQLQTLHDLMDGLALRLGEAEGNPELLATIKCAQDNAAAQSGALVSSMDPIAGVIALVKPFAKIAQVDLDISLEASPSPEGADALEPVIATLQAAVDAIDAIVGG